MFRFILPILAEYSDAGYREPKDKLKYSLRSNAQFHAMVLSIGSVGLIYFFIKSEFSFGTVKALIMAMAYCWGLILAIYLMGHGLVSIPRRLIRSASISGRLRRLQSHAPKVHEQMEDALTCLEDVEAQVSELGRRKTGSAVAFRDWIDEIQEIANVPESRASRFGSTGQGNNSIIPHIITEKYLADLTRTLIRTRHAKSRYDEAWNDLVQEASDTQAILDSAASKKLEFVEVFPHVGFWDKMTVFTPYTRYLYYYHFLPYAQIILGVILAVASACIVWSEVIKSAFPKLSVIRLSVIYHWVGDRAEVGFAGQLISAFWICYMCGAALISMTEVKVWRGRALVRRNTAHESAFWYAMQVAKLSIPLAYNYMTFLSMDVTKKTIFYKFLGSRIDLTPLPRVFDDFFPIIILFPVCATLFGIYGRVKRIFVGIDIIDEGDDGPTYGTGSWREGRDLIARELGGSSILGRREGANARGGNTGGYSAPILSIPSARGSSTSPARSPAPAPSTQRPAGPHGRYWDEAPPEDDNIFAIIGHRMKNTIDRIETPEWMQDIGQGIKKPKWMGNDNEGESSSGGGGGDGGNNDFRRWFGGGSDGNIRL